MKLLTDKVVVKYDIIMEFIKRTSDKDETIIYSNHNWFLFVGI